MVGWLVTPLAPNRELIPLPLLLHRLRRLCLRTLCTGLSHPNICSLYAFSVETEQPCLVLELCAGGALDARLHCPPGSACPPLPWQARVRIATLVARALVFLHSRQPPLVHRDMKSANVLLDGGDRAKVADFGAVYEVEPGELGGATHFQVGRDDCRLLIAAC